MAKQQLNAGSLPLHLLSFTGQKQNTKALLKWITTDEENTSRFEIYKGRSPASLTFAGTIAALGNSNSNHEYNYTDAVPFPGENYYQLKMIDRDGRFTLSPVIHINFDETSAISVFPNPVKGKEVTVTLNNNINIKSATLISIDGKQNNCEFTANSTLAKVSLPATIARGVYSLRLLTDKGTNSTTILVQ